MTDILFEIKHADTMISADTFTSLGSSKYIDNINNDDDALNVNIKEADTINLKYNNNTIASRNVEFVNSYTPTDIWNLLQTQTTIQTNTDINIAPQILLCGNDITSQTNATTQTFYFYPECSFVDSINAITTSNDGNIINTEINISTTSQIDDDSFIVKSATLKRLFNGTETTLTTYNNSDLSNPNLTYADSINYGTMGLSSGNHQITYKIEYQYESITNSGPNRTISPKTSSKTANVTLTISNITLYTQLYDLSDVLRASTSSYLDYSPNMMFNKIVSHYKIDSPNASYTYHFICLLNTTIINEFDITEFDDGAGGEVEVISTVSPNKSTEFGDPITVKIQVFDSGNVLISEIDNIFHFPQFDFNISANNNVIALNENVTLTLSGTLSSGDTYGNLVLQRKKAGDNSWTDIQTFTYPTTTPHDLSITVPSYQYTDTLGEYGTFSYRFYINSNDEGVFDKNSQIVNVIVRNPYNPTNQII